MYFRIRPVAPLSSRHTILIVGDEGEVADARLQEIWDDNEEYDIFNLPTEYSKDTRNFPRVYSCVPLRPKCSSIVELVNPGHRYIYREWNGLTRWEFESLVPLNLKEETHYNMFFSRNIISIESNVFRRFERVLNSTGYDPIINLIKGDRQCTVKIYLDYDLKNYQGGNYVEFCVSPDMTVESFLIALCEGLMSDYFGLTQILYDGPGGIGKKYTIKDVRGTGIKVKSWDIDYDRTMCFLLSTKEEELRTEIHQ